MAALVSILFLELSTTGHLSAQGSQVPGQPPVYVDGQGVMRWSDSDAEVALFGVNYYTPFSQTYRGMNVMGKDHKEAIDEDIYHLARLGLDAFRTHLYEIEITDSLGNLLENHHLDLHDYTIHKMNERGIRTILTPTTYYSSAFPDGNVVQPPGFPNYITKAQAPRVPEFRPVIKNYLAQLINHVNPYTGMTAIDDPNIIALEIDNEPSHGPDVDGTREFVNELANHLRESGWNKPIFYNISHSFSVTDAFLDADIDGVTFQWYPAGLYEGVTNRKNYFPYVNRFTVPWEDDERYQKLALMVYEFDPADAMHSYAIPMMARGFREAGMQFAAQFAYTALGIAHVNTDWRSHYLNLVYTPSKAVGMLVGSEVFRRVGRREQFADFPADTIFGDFRMSHALDLSEMNAEEAFLYSNDTQAIPRNEPALQRVVGVGSSVVVSYPGTGAYFLDRLDNGVWRLEVMPDAILVRDPFEAPAFDKHVAHVEWREHRMQIRLTNLGQVFQVTGLNEGNGFSTTVRDGSFVVSPGAYLLTRDGVSGEQWGPDSRMGALRLGEYHAASPNANAPVVNHRPYENVAAGQPVTISAKVVGLDPGNTVLLQVNPFTGPNQRIEMREVSPYVFETEIPAEAVAVGALRYWIVVDRGANNFVSFPGNNPTAPWRWNYYYSEDHWLTQVVAPGAPLEIWNANRDHLKTYTGFGGASENESALVSTPWPAQVARHVSTTAPTAHRHVLGIATRIRDRIEGISGPTINSYQHLVVRAKTDHPLPAPLKVVLVDTRGNSYSAPVPVTGSYQEHRILLSSFAPDRFMLLPRAYPSIMESWYATGVPGPVELEWVDEIQLLVDTTGISNLSGERYGFEIQSVWLE